MSDRDPTPASTTPPEPPPAARHRLRIRFPRLRSAAAAPPDASTGPRVPKPRLRRTKRVAHHSGNLFLDVMAWAIVAGALYLGAVLIAGLYFRAEDRVLLDSGKVPKKLEEQGYDDETLRSLFMQYYVAAAAPSMPSALPALPIINNGFVRAPASRPWLIHRETSIELAGVKSQPMAFIAAGVQFFRLYEHFYRLDVTEDEELYTLALSRSSDAGTVIWTGAGKNIRELVADAAASLAQRNVSTAATPTPDDLRKLECALIDESARRNEDALVRLGYVQVQLGKWDEALSNFRRALAAATGPTGDTALASLPRPSAPPSPTGQEGQPEPRAAQCSTAAPKPEVPGDTSGARVPEGTPPEAVAPQPATLPTPNVAQLRRMVQADRVLLGFGLVALQRKRWDEAYDYFDLAARANPLNESAHIGLAETALRRAEDARAIEHFLRATRLNPNNDSTYANLGAAYLQAGKIDEAAAVLARAVTLNPRNVAGLLNLGRVALMRREFSEAAKIYDRAAAFAPDDPGVLAGLGEAYLALGRHEAALAKFERALDTLNRSQPGATADAAAMRLTWRTTSMLGLSLAAFGLPDTDRRAAEIFGGLTDEWRADNDVGRTYAIVLLRLGKNEQARDEFQKVLSTEASDVRASIGLAEAFDRLGQNDMAQVSYERAFRADPKSSETLMLWGKWLVKAGQHPLAIEKFIAASALDPEDPTPLTAWAEALALQKKFDEAEAKCRQALAIAMTDPAANVCLFAVRDARAKEK